MPAHTFLWHDYETFGIKPRSDRPAQFAGIRTDADLNEIGEPLMLYCQPAPDFLPDPQACLITHITPQICLARGLPEYQFASIIERALSEPGTIGVGYNTIGFDDEVTRFLFWRNLIDPYAREWQNSCGRWDLLDVVRTAHALRQEGISWPKHDGGRPSFKLEHLTKANGIAHDSAHDALSDVRATIALARLIRQHQPKLFDFCLTLHKKDRVNAEVGWPVKRPFLHVSGMFKPEKGCIALVFPLAIHPTNKNEIITWDLAYDPTELTALDADMIRQRMFSRADSLPEGMMRLPIKTIHVNKSPIVISNLKTLSPDMAARWNIDLDQAAQHAKVLETNSPSPELWKQVFDRLKQDQVDVDEDLYGGFIGSEDRRTLTNLRQMSPEALAAAAPAFEDDRLEELVFRYRARNFPDSLTEAGAERWETHRGTRLLNGAYGARNVQSFFDEIDLLSEKADSESEEILSALYDYAERIVPSH